MITEEIKHEIEKDIFDSIAAQIDDLKNLQEGGWTITLEDSVEDLLDMQSSYSLRHSLLEEPVALRKAGPLSREVLDEAEAYTEEVLTKVEHLPLRVFKDEFSSRTL